MAAGPSSHLSWNELACWNRLGRPVDGHAPGELIAPYPARLWAGRVDRLAATFEEIRAELGGKPLFVNSAYRTPAYNRAVGGAPASQHVHGRALDIRHATYSPEELFLTIRALATAGRLPLLGGVGRYRTFVHIDVRARTAGRLALWGAGDETRSQRG